MGTGFSLLTYLLTYMVVVGPNTATTGPHIFIYLLTHSLTA